MSIKIFFRLIYLGLFIIGIALLSFFSFRNDEEKFISLKKIQTFFDALPVSADVPGKGVTEGGAESGAGEGAGAESGCGAESSCGAESGESGEGS